MIADRTAGSVHDTSVCSDLLSIGLRSATFTSNTLAMNGYMAECVT